MKIYKTLVVIFFIIIGYDSYAQENNKEILTNEEKHILRELREEEKLARDVYLYAYEKYGLPIFSNISHSEQRHMDQALYLLEKYDLGDSATRQKGVFNSKKLQELYKRLTAKVDKSLLDALEVGAIIEDLDIKDIREFRKKTNKILIINTFNKLECGSRNHMRAFIAQITSRGRKYRPHYINESLFTEIITSPHERCGRL